MMKLFVSTILYSVTLLVLPACEVIETLQEFVEQSETASTIIENQIGSKPAIAGNIENGILTEVNVYFEHLADKDITVAEMEQVVKSSVDNYIKKQPQKLLITINVNK